MRKFWSLTVSVSLTSLPLFYRMRFVLTSIGDRMEKEFLTCWLFLSVPIFLPKHGLPCLSSLAVRKPLSIFLTRLQCAPGCSLSVSDRSSWKELKVCKRTGNRTHFVLLALFFCKLMLHLLLRRFFTH